MTTLLVEVDQEDLPLLVQCPVSTCKRLRPLYEYLYSNVSAIEGAYDFSGTCQCCMDYGPPCSDCGKRFWPQLVAVCANCHTEPMHN